MPRTRQMNRRQFLQSFSHPESSPDTKLSTISPISRHFRQDIHRSAPPLLDTTFWALRLFGQVATQGLYSIDDLTAFEPKTIVCALACAGLPQNNALIGQAEWRGASFPEVLACSAPHRNDGYANFYSRDGYTTSLPVAELQQAVLAYAMNDIPLPAEHGYPLRLIVPGHYGYKMPKWIDRIQISSAPVSGFWESRGWPQDGSVSLHSILLHPSQWFISGQHAILSGIAYAGSLPITSVELSISHSAWMSVDHLTGTPPAWASWQIAWTPPQPGHYHLAVRASSADDRHPSQPQYTTMLQVGE